MEGSRTHTRAQNCQNEREIHGRKKPKSSFLGGEKQIVQIICCASSNLFSLALCSSVSSPAYFGTLQSLGKLSDWTPQGVHAGRREHLSLHRIA